MERPEGCPQWHPLGASHRRSLGGFTKTISATLNVPSSIPNVGAHEGPRPNPARDCEGPSRTRKTRSHRGLYRWHPRGGEKGGSYVGRTRRGKATKIMAMADRHGLPIAIGIASGERHETKLVVETLQSRFVGPVPVRLIGDRAYDSDPLDRQMKKFGVEMIAPNRVSKRVPTQDGRPLRRYKRRWHIERLFSWLLRFRRLVTRYEYHAANFLGLAKLACLAILLKRL